MHLDRLQGTGAACLHYTDYTGYIEYGKEHIRQEGIRRAHHNTVTKT